MNKYKIDISNIKNEKGLNPLQISVTNDNINAFKTLYRYINTTNTPLDIFNAKNDQNYSLLHIACATAS